MASYERKKVGCKTQWILNCMCFHKCVYLRNWTGTETFRKMHSTLLASEGSLFVLFYNQYFVSNFYWEEEVPV